MYIIIFLCFKSFIYGTSHIIPPQTYMSNCKKLYGLKIQNLGTIISYDLQNY